MASAFGLEKTSDSELIDALRRYWRDIYRCLGLRQGMDSEGRRFAATLAIDECPSSPLGEKEASETLLRQATCREDTAARGIRECASWLLQVTRACDEIRKDPRLNAVTRISQARLVAVALLLRDDLVEERKRRLLPLWERVVFRIYGLYGKDARTRVGDFVRLAWRISKEKLAADAIADELSRIDEAFPIAGAIDMLRGRGVYPDWADELRYFFYKYDEHLAKQQGQQLRNKNWQPIWEASTSDSIEHILPRSKAPEAEADRLGNLLLLPPRLNKQLQDRDPAEKKNEYLSTGLFVAREVADRLEQWDAKAIAEREERLLEWAANEWG